MRSIKIDTKGGTFTMSIEEFARWAAMVEALEFIHEVAAIKRVDAADYFKSKEIEKYIDERYPSIRHDVNVESQLGIL